MLREISRGMVRLYKQQFGRGPSAASTRYCGPDMIVTILSDTLTPAERRMRQMGEEHRLRERRDVFQHALEQEFRDVVEGVANRRVVGFMSGIDVARDLCCEVFTLEPEESASGRA